MNGKPTAAQKRFHDWCRDFGCVVCLCDTAIHHINGSRMKLKGCKNPGEWYILPLCYRHHQGEDGIHTDKKKFTERYRPQKEIWKDLIHEYKNEHGTFPMSEEEYQIIMERA